MNTALQTHPEADALPDEDDAADTATEPRGLGGKLAGLSLRRQVFVLAVWPFFQQVLNWLVSAVDTAVAGRLSVEATNAIGVTGYIGWLMGLLSMAVGAGAAALIARAVGGRHRGLANAGLGQALVIALVWGTFIGVGLYAGAQGICRAAGLTGESLGLAVLYLRILAVSSPLAALLFVGSMSLSAAGDTRSPFWVMLAVNVVNIGATLGLVSGGYGVAGIAAGTTAAYTLGGLIIVGVLLRPGGPIRLRSHRLRPHAQTIRRILRVATPNLGDRLGHWLGNFGVL
ncbi:MAG: MATE family efflux transporter, partial [Planctomycetota bacterium]